MPIYYKGHILHGDHNNLKELQIITVSEKMAVNVTWDSKYNWFVIKYSFTVVY